MESRVHYHIHKSLLTDRSLSPASPVHMSNSSPVFESYLFSSMIHLRFS
jgi:hypothetical protein